MDRSAKSFFAVSLLVIALMIITNLVINNKETPGTQELLAALLTLGGSIAFWVWLWLDGRAAVETPVRPDDGTGSLQLPQRQAQEWVISRQPTSTPGMIPHTALPFEPVAPVGHEHGEIPDDPAPAATMPAATAVPVMVMDEPLEPEIQPGADILVTDEVPAVKIEATADAVTDAVGVTEPVVEEKMEPEIAPIHIEVTDEVPVVKIEAEEPAEADTSHGVSADRDSSATTAPTIEVSAVAGDDLTEIEGIGPKYNDILHSGGILTYGQLAISTKEELTTILHNAGSTRIPTSIETWAEQAGYLARDDMDGLRKFQSELVGGRHPGTGDD